MSFAQIGISASKYFQNMSHPDSLPQSVGDSAIDDWTFTENKVHLSEKWKTELDISANNTGISLSTWYQRIHEDDLDMFKRKFQDLLNGTFFNIECTFRLKNKNGRFYPVKFIAMAVPKHFNQSSEIRGNIISIPEISAFFSILYQSS